MAGSSVVGSPKRFSFPLTQLVSDLHVKPELRFLLCLLMQLLSQQRELLRHGRFFRSGVSQAVLLSSYSACFRSARKTGTSVPALPSDAAFVSAKRASPAWPVLP